MTNQDPATGVGEHVDVDFVAPALRAYGPDQPRPSRTQPLDGSTLHRYAVRCGSGLTIVAITYGLAGFLIEVTGILDYTPASGSMTIRAVLAAGLSTVAVAGHLLRTKRPALATALLVIGGFAYVPLSNDIAAAFIVPVAVALTAVLSLPNRSRVRSNT